MYFRLYIIQVTVIGIKNKDFHLKKTETFKILTIKVKSNFCNIYLNQNISIDL